MVASQHVAYFIMAAMQLIPKRLEIGKQHVQPWLVSDEDSRFNGPVLRRWRA